MFCLSAIFLAIASVTRPTGMLLWPAFLVALWEVGALKSLRGLLSLLIVPLGIISFSAYLHKITGNPLAFIDIQVTWDRFSGNFLERCIEILPQLKVPIADWNFVWLNLACIFLGLYATFYLIKSKRYSLALVVIMPFLVALYSCSFMSISRYTITLFPIFIVLGEGLSPTLERMFFTISAALLGILVMLYSLQVTAAMT
jgi:hypothetical protein